MEEILIPNYLADFRCDGAICEDNCCTGNWRILVDKKHYKLYRSINKSKCKEKIKKFIKRNPDAKSDWDYAIIHQDKLKEQCAFLDDKKMCSIQKELGAHYLCDTCMMYPRFAKSIDEEIEIVLSVSCPIAARLILLNPKGIEFKKVNMNDVFGFRKAQISMLSSSKAIKSNKLILHFQTLRTFSFQLMRSRDYTIEERLIILGMLFDKIQKSIDSGSDIVMETIDTFTRRIQNGDFKSLLENLQSQNKLQIFLLKSLMEERIFFASSIEKRFLDCVVESLVGIDYKEEENLDKSAENLSNAYEMYYRPYIRDKEYILENYIVNYMYKNAFPFTELNNTFDLFYLLVVHYSIIKIMLIGISGLYKEQFGVEHIIRVIQSFSKAVEHSPMFETHMYDLLKDNSLNTLAHAIILINNEMQNS